MNCSSCLVVGMDSLIGKALIDRLREMGTQALGTTRRQHPEDQQALYLDLAREETWDLPASTDLTIICAGITKLEACEKAPDETARVNVHGVSSLARRMAARGSFVIFLSTTQVYDGRVALRSPDAPPCPVTEYGRQKAEAERSLLAHGASAAVIRLSKILPPRAPLLSHWKAALQQGRPIHPFSDMFFSPLPLGFCVDVILRVAAKRASGIIQASARGDVSYEEAARIVATHLNVDHSLIQPVSSATAGFKDAPRHTALNTDRLETEIGSLPPPVADTILAASA